MHFCSKAVCCLCCLCSHRRPHLGDDGGACPHQRAQIHGPRRLSVPQRPAWAQAAAAAHAAAHQAAQLLLCCQQRVAARRRGGAAAGAAVVLRSSAPATIGICSSLFGCYCRCPRMREHGSGGSTRGRQRARLDAGGDGSGLQRKAGGHDMDAARQLGLAGLAPLRQRHRGRHLCGHAYSSSLCSGRLLVGRRLVRRQRSGAARPPPARCRHAQAQAQQQ